MATTTIGGSDRTKRRDEDFQRNPDEQQEMSLVTTILDLIKQDPSYAPKSDELQYLSQTQRRMLVNGLQGLIREHDDAEVTLTVSAAKGGVRGRLKALWPGGRQRDVSRKDAEAGKHRSAVRDIKALILQIDAMEPKFQ